MLNLRWCKGLDFQSIRYIVTNCKELTFLDLSYTNISQDSLNFIANNLTQKIMKLDLSALDNIRDEHINTLVSNCDRIVDLGVDYNNDITNNSLTSIIEYLKPTLIKLSVNHTSIDYVELQELKSMPRLKFPN